MAITLIGILAAGIITIVNPVAQFQKANDAKRKSDLGQLQRILETYYNDNGRYPGTCDPHKIEELDGDCLDWGAEWETYISALPKDPKSTNKYVYYSPADGQYYRLYASLERGGNDPQACLPSGAACPGFSSIPGGPVCGGVGVICNYGVTSPNVSP